VAYNTAFHFDSVAVIESLAQGELRTGQDLFETILAPASIADPGFVSELYLAPSKSEFVKTLAGIGIRTAASQFGRSPIVHIEAHGDTDGIHLASGELVKWSEIAPILTAINELSRLNLLVVAGMCHGWHMSSILRPVDRAPVFGVVGSLDEASAGQLLRAMQVFYQTLLGPDHDLRAALEGANATVVARDWELRMEGAELMLCKVYTHYTETETDESRQQRINHLVAEVARISTLDVTQTMRVRADVTAKLDDHGYWFDHYRDRFLMLDLFPDNDYRFPLRVGDCSRASVWPAQ